MFCAGCMCVSHGELHMLGQSHMTPTTGFHQPSKTMAWGVSAIPPLPGALQRRPRHHRVLAHCPVQDTRFPVPRSLSSSFPPLMNAVQPTSGDNVARSMWHLLQPVGTARLKSCKIGCDVWASVAKTQVRGTEVKEEKA